MTRAELQACKERNRAFWATVPSARVKLDHPAHFTPAMRVNFWEEVANGNIPDPREG